MPTTKRRHALTETPDITAALAIAARRWPEDWDRPTRLLKHLVHEGAASISPEVEAQTQERLAAVRRISGAYTGMYEPGYLDQLRTDWPE